MMVRYAQLVIGPAGSGKSTYVSAIINHGKSLSRTIRAVNLDAAAEHFDYDAMVDIRDLIHTDDVMDDQQLNYGPNGALVFAMEYLLENSDWFREQLGDEDEDYVMFDCAGQIELSTHLSVMRNICDLLQSYDFRVTVVFLLDSQFVTDMSKFFSGLMVSLASMINLEVPTFNILTKTDLLDKSAKKQLERFLEPDSYLLEEEFNSSHCWGQKYTKLTQTFGKLIDDYALIKFMPINVFDEDSLNDVLLCIDNALQFDENQEVKVRDFDDEPNETNGDNGINHL